MDNNPQNLASQASSASQDAEADWQEFTAADGRRYYYNKKTKQSSWEKPLELMTLLERADATTVWKEFTTAEGKKYYYNKDTKESQWTIPDELKLAREQAEKEASRGTRSPATSTPSTLDQLSASVSSANVIPVANVMAESSSLIPVAVTPVSANMHSSPMAKLDNSSLHAAPKALDGVSSGDAGGDLPSGSWQPPLGCAANDDVFDDVRDTEVDDDVPVEVDVRGKKKKTTRAPNIPWSGEDEAFLTKAYFHISTDPKFGDQQKFNSFWQRVKEHYSTLQNKHSRSYHQINTKCKLLQAKLKEFSDIYANMKHLWGSGQDDANILKMALVEWAKTHKNKPFQHLLAWEIAQQQEKFQYVPPLGGTFTNPNTPTGGDGSGSGDKRARTSESGHYTSLPKVNEDVMPTLPHKTKNKAQSSKNNSSLFESDDEYKLLKLQEKEEKKLTREMAYNAICEREKLARDLLLQQLEFQRQQQMDLDLKLYADPHEHLVEPVRGIVVQRKHDIADKYGWPHPEY